MSNGILRVDGTKIVDASGNEVILRGVCNICKSLRIEGEMLILLVNRLVWEDG